MLRDAKLEAEPSSVPSVRAIQRERVCPTGAGCPPPALGRSCSRLGAIGRDGSWRSGTSAAPPSAVTSFLARVAIAVGSLPVLLVPRSARALGEVEGSPRTGPRSTADAVARDVVPAALRAVDSGHACSRPEPHVTGTWRSVIRAG